MSGTDEGRARVALLVVVTAVTSIAATLAFPAPSIAAGSHAAEGLVARSTPSNVSATEQAFLASCPDIPPSQGDDAYVFELPEALDGKAATATRIDSDGPGAPDLGMAFYNAECAEVGRADSVAQTEKAPVPTGTKWVVVFVKQSTLPATNTTVCLTIGEAVCPSQAPSGSITSSPSASATTTADTSASPSNSATQASTTPQKSPTAARGIIFTTIESTRTRVGFRRRFRLSGMVEGEPGCARPFEVTIHRRVGGSDYPRLFRSKVVEDDGTWRIPLRARASATYSATARSSSCKSQPPAEETVLVRVKISVGFAGPCSAPQLVTGRVKPRHPKTNVMLQRRTNAEYVTVDKDKLDRQSRYELVAQTCAGKFRVRWPSQERGNTHGAKRFHF